MAEREKKNVVKNYKMILQYDGTRYDGWQKQGNTDATIQGKLEGVLKKLTGTECEIHGSGRTDAGAHALCQTANFHADLEMNPDGIKEYFNRYLPEDIAVLSVETVSDRFHSRLSAVEKTYLYRIETSPKKDVFERKYTYGLGEMPDVERMKRAASFFLGEHDFKSFCSNKKMKKSTVRRITGIDIELEGTKLSIRYRGDGFLYNMVRILTGTLIETGLGKREPEEMKDILLKKDRQAAGFTAPAEGLFLEAVQYRQ